MSEVTRIIIELQEHPNQNWNEIHVRVAAASEGIAIASGFHLTTVFPSVLREIAEASAALMVPIAGRIMKKYADFEGQTPREYLYRLESNTETPIQNFDI